MFLLSRQFVLIGVLQNLKLSSDLGRVVPIAAGIQLQDGSAIGRKLTWHLTSSACVSPLRNPGKDR